MVGKSGNRRNRKTARVASSYLNGTEGSFLRGLFLSIGTPLALAARKLLVSGDFLGLSELASELPSSDQDAWHFACDYLVSVIASKSTETPGNDALTREVAAIQSFLTDNDWCASTNERFRMPSVRFGRNSADTLAAVLVGHCFDPTGEPFEREARIGWLERYQRYVQQGLGDLDKVALQRIESLMGHGPGATVGIRAMGEARSNKWRVPEWTATPDLMAYEMGFDLFRCEDYRHCGAVDATDFGDEPSVTWTRVPGGHGFTVPKNAETDRFAVKEPTANAFVQAGIGSYIAERLRLVFGIDLQDQTLNQRYAQNAYKGYGACIDLKGASNCTACGPVARYFPLAWVHLLDLCRSPKVAVKLPMADGTLSQEPSWVEAEMLSSMGNGYTFPIETLIFICVARAVTPPEVWDRIAVYGDDMVVPAESALLVIEALEFLGYRVNSKKTRLAGAFFESCGSYWFKGQDVKPFYARYGGCTSDLDYHRTLLNSLRVWLQAQKANLNGEPDETWSRIYDFWCDEVNSLPPEIRMCAVPPDLGAEGLVVYRNDRAWARVCVGIDASEEYFSDPSLRKAESRYLTGRRRFIRRGFEERQLCYSRVPVTSTVDYQDYPMWWSSFHDRVVSTYTPHSDVPIVGVRASKWLPHGWRDLRPPSRGLEDRKGCVTHIKRWSCLTQDWP